MYAQSIQLENLFGQNQIDFTQDINQTAFYDELAFGKIWILVCWTRKLNLSIF